jgi:hypothetical protein
MAEQALGTEPYATQYSERGRESRDELPPEAKSALFDVLDALAANPDAFPGRVHAIGRDRRIRLYSHPSPPLEVTYEIDTSRRVLHLWHFVAPKVQVTKPAFISYSHEDAKWRERLKPFLQPLVDEGLIRVWDDTEIRPGSDWLGEIGMALESARLAVFLVTQNLHASQFVKNVELPALLEAANNRGCLIFWIPVSSTPFELSPFAKYQAAIPPNQPLDLMSVPKQNKAFTEIARKMRPALSVSD